MKYVVMAQVQDHTISVPAKTMKEAMAQAVEWKVVERFTDIVIRSGDDRYSIDEFAELMARGRKTE
jgi:hypothetical protein